MRQPLKILILVLSFGGFAMHSAHAQEFVRMVSGPAGGSWYPLGAKLAEIWGKSVEGIATSNGPGGGVSNVQDVNKGEAEVGWTYAHTAYNGFSGEGKFKAAQENVRYLATLYPSALQTVVPKDSPIQSYMDLKDKNLSPGKAKWSGFAAAELVFQAHGFGIDDVKSGGGTVHHVSYSDSVALMKDGHIDAFTALTSVPQASLIDLNTSPGVRFLPIEDDVRKKLLADYTGYIDAVIPAAAYEGLGTDVPTLGVVAVLVVNKDVSDEIAYGLTKSLWENHGELVKVKDIWNSVKLDDGLLGAKIPVHPGAMKFYSENSIAVK